MRLPVLPARLETLLVLGVTLVFGMVALSLAPLSEPLGIDVQRYLGNAVAISTEEWTRYHTWRGPLHAWALLGLAPWMGGLVPASQVLALFAVTSLLPLTWWMGRALWGQWPALLGLGVLVSWPDLALFARTSTPYPLVALLVVAGLASGLAALRHHWGWSVVAGSCLGLCVGADVRGGVLAASVLGSLALLAATRTQWRRGGLLLVVAGGLSMGLGSAVLDSIPVKLTPLAEQVQFQRELHGRQGPPNCDETPVALGLGAVWTPCAWETLRANLARAEGATPVPMALLLLLGVLGAFRRPEGDRWAALLLWLPMLPAVPAVILVGVEARYLLPWAALWAPLVGSGLVVLAERVSRPRRALAVAFLAVLGLGIAWWLHPGTRLDHARTPGSPDAGPGAGRLLHRSPLAAVAEAIGDPVGKDRVVDCTRAGLDIWLHPFSVETLRPGRGERWHPRCSRLLEAGPSPQRGTWVLVRIRPGSTASGGWTEVFRDPLAGPGGQLVLLRGARKGQESDL